MLTQRCRRLHVTSASIVSHFLNFTGGVFQHHIKPLLLSLFTIIPIMSWQAGLEYCQHICNHCLQVQVSTLKPYATVLPPHHEPMLYLQEPSYPLYLPLVEHMVVGVPPPFGILREGEFGLLKADWQFCFCTTQVR